MKRAILLSALSGLALASAAHADLVYDRSTQSGSRLTGTSASIVTFDDIFIASAALNGETSLHVTSVTVGIRRVAGAPAVDATIWWADMVGTTVGAIAPGTVQSLGTTSFGVQAATTTQLFTLSNPAGLFDITPNQSVMGAEGFGGFFIGLQMDSATSNLNGWRITTGGPAGASTANAYQHNPANPEDPATNGLFNFGAGQIAASFYVVVEGTPFSVPTPGAAALGGLGMAMIARRRR